MGWPGIIPIFNSQIMNSSEITISFNNTQWEPHTIFHCLNNDILAYITIFAALGVLIWYFIIAFTTWFPGAKSSGKEGRNAIYWMAIIFLICAITGYGSLALTGWMPKFAYSLRILGLISLNIFCPWFLLSKGSQSFRLITKEQKVGHDFLSIKNIDEYGDKELAQKTRELLAERVQKEALKYGII